MPEEIRPIQTIQRGFVNTNRPGPTGLSRLADALQRSARGGQNALKGIEKAVRQGEAIKADEERRSAAAEEERISNILESPGVTQAELDELENNVRFPVNRIKIDNRRGYLIVNEVEADLVDAVSRAGDVVEAREILRAKQHELLQGLSPGVAAGVREKMAGLAPGLLNDAAKRRFETHKQEDYDITASEIRHNLEAGPDTFFTSFSSLLEEEQTSAQSIPDFIDRAVDTMHSYYLEGDDEELGGANLHADEVLDAIDLILESNIVEGKNRKAFAALRSRIESDEVQRLTSGGALDRENKKAAHTSLGAQLLRFRLMNPDLPDPEELVEAYIDTADTAAELRATEDFLRPRRVIDTPQYKNAYKHLKATFTQDGAFDLEEVGPTVLADFESIVRGMDPDILKDPTELNRQLDNLSLTLQKEGATLRDRQKATEERTLNEIESITRRAASIEKYGINPEHAAELRQKAAFLSQDLAKKAHMATLMQIAKLAKIDFYDMVNTTE